MLWPLPIMLSNIFTIFVLLHLSTSISCLPGLWVCCGREPTSVHPNAPQLERPLHNSRRWDGDTSCKHLEGNVVSTFFSQGLDDLLSMSLVNSNVIHIPRVVGGWMISSVLQCVLELRSFALKCTCVFLLCGAVLENDTLGFILPLFSTIFGDKIWRKKPTNYLDTWLLWCISVI